MMEGIYLLLGSNLGDRKQSLALAQSSIQAEIGPVEKTSAIHVSSAWGLSEQPDFLNQVLFVKTDLEPEDVLNRIQKIELQLGRERYEKWGPRIIDIDILYFGERVVQTHDLIIPHPGIPERRFTLKPLKEIAPDFIHPVLKISNSELLDLCNDSLGVQVLLEA